MAEKGKGSAGLVELMRQAQTGMEDDLEVSKEGKGIQGKEKKTPVLLYQEEKMAFRPNESFDDCSTDLVHEVERKQKL